MSTFCTSAFATCSITGGACTVSNWDSKPLQEKYAPDNLQELEKPDAFQPELVTPYNDALINTESSKVKTSPASDYNSNCQFGICLPETEREIVE